MFFRKKKNDGSVPIEYKRGKIKNNVYRSKCLGYTIQICDGFEVRDAEHCERESTPEDICDFFGILATDVHVGVNYIPHDGSVMISDNATRDMLGSAMATRLNEQQRGRAESTYYGVVDFCGKPCCHSIMHSQKDGKEWICELYQYYSSYYMLQFGFLYLPENKWHVDEAKALFSSSS